MCLIHRTFFSSSRKASNSVYPSLHISQWTIYSADAFGTSSNQLSCFLIKNPNKQHLSSVANNLIFLCDVWCWKLNIVQLHKHIKMWERDSVWSVTQEQLCFSRIAAHLRAWRQAHSQDSLLPIHCSQGQFSDFSEVVCKFVGQSCERAAALPGSAVGMAWIRSGK